MGCRRRGRTAASASTSVPSIARNLLNFNTDIEFQTGDLAGQGGPTLPNHGSFDVRELFTEVQVPIISHSFIEEFTITGGYRYSDYKIDGGNSFNTDTYKLSAELAPDPRHPLPGQLQPRGPRAEHRRIVLPAGPWPVGRIRPVRGHDARSVGGAVRQHRNAGNAVRHGRCEPGQPVQYPVRWQREPDTGKGRHLHAWCRRSAALGSGPRLHRRLLQHQGEEPDRRASVQRRSCQLRSHG